MSSSILFYVKEIRFTTWLDIESYLVPLEVSAHGCVSLLSTTVHNAAAVETQNHVIKDQPHCDVILYKNEETGFFFCHYRPFSFSRL